MAAGTQREVEVLSSPVAAPSLSRRSFDEGLRLLP